MHRALFLLLALAGIAQVRPSQAAYSATAAGGRHTCAIGDDGAVSCWGENYYGQLGLGDTASRNIPVLVPGLSGVKALAAGGLHTCAVVQQDGSVRCWGNNESGQLGLDTTENASVPTPVHGLTGVVAIAAGYEHTCASTQNATYCWGNNAYGQLGLNNTINRPVPAVLPTLNGSAIQSLAAGQGHTCATTTQGAVLCWGLNNGGQLGIGDNADRLQPAGVTGLGIGAGATAVYAGDRHTCAIKAGNVLMCWGANTAGQLGQDNHTGSNVPKQVLWGGVTRVATGGNHTCAVLSYILYCWGENVAGQLGLGDNRERLKPASVAGSYTGTLALAAGDRHTCLIEGNGNMDCWGENSYSQLGLELAHHQRQPTPVRGFSGVATSGTLALAAGASHTCALAAGDGIACWGAGSYGGLGIGDSNDRALPAVLANQAGLLSVTTGTLFSCALKQGGGVSCWGRNSYGELGNGNLISTDVPGDVLSVNDALAVSAGHTHACVIRQGGAVACWGSNNYGQLGRGTSNASGSPADIPNFGSASAIAAGAAHNCAITTTAKVYCWGRNASGQLGIGSTTDQYSPVIVPDLDNVVSLAAGWDHTCAAKVDGSVLCWGYNGSGRLGIGGLSGTRTSPTLVPGLSDAVQLTAGSEYTCASKTDGSVVCWGSNSSGQLGLDGEEARPTPTPVPGIGTVTAVAAGDYHTCALKPDDTVLCWGYNYYGQLGIGTLGYARRPRQLDHMLRDGFDQPEIP